MELDPADFARLLEGAARGLLPTVREAETESLRDVQDRMLRWSSGGESLKALRDAGHPHGRARGTRQRHPVLINRQSGRLQESLAAEEPAEHEGGTVAAAWFAAPHGRYLFDDEASEFDDGGTKLMFGRDVPGQVVEELEDLRADRFEAAVAGLFRVQ